ncbi:uncharacterized protein FRV6_11650 [Fusarium oxysporum]|uniref:Uncharacterized protein n=1 Tax=Fusarium oxysporum TaxID=5507 RepID=A0A2H3TFP4_FUSOX|nr:uncharacterized protein FRV6_11650 [Fusarium oxysporum]
MQNILIKRLKSFLHLRPNRLA